MTKAEELLALANDMQDWANDAPPLRFVPVSPSTLCKAASALHEYAGMLDAEPVAWMNVKYGTFFGAGVIAATDRNDDLIASGELVRLYTHPPAPQRVPLTDALRRIAALHPETNSDEGYNEWGEADCFRQAQDIARAVLAAQQEKK